MHRPSPEAGLPCLSTMRWTASSGRSTTSTSFKSWSARAPSLTGGGFEPNSEAVPVVTAEEDHRKRRQVFTKFRASKSSSKVPKPPGKHTNAQACFTKANLRRKK